MRRLLSRIAGLGPGDFSAALPLFALQAGIAAYWAIAASAGDALLLSFLREHSLPVRTVVPWTYLAIAAATGAAMTAFDALQKRVSRRGLLIAAPLAFAASIAAARPLLALDGAWLRFALAVWLEVAALVSMTLSFSLIADRFGSRDAKRLYGFIGGGFCAGLAAGGSAVPWLAGRFGAENLLIVAAGVLCANAALTAGVTRSAAAAAQAGTAEAAPPLRALASDGYLALVAAAVFLGAALFVLVDFQLKSLASGLPQDLIAALYGRLYGWAGVAEALVQFLLLRPLIRRLGVLNLQLAYPALMAAGAAATMRTPGLAAAAAVNLARMVSSESVERPTRELLFAPLAPRLRGRAQALIDGTVASCGQAAAAIALLVFAAALADQRALAACALAAAVLALAPLLFLRPRYRRLLSSAVRTKPLEAVDLARLAREPGARELIERMASSADEREARLARAVLARADASGPSGPEPESLARLADPALTSAGRCALAADLGRRGGEPSARALWSLLPASDSALAAAAARGALEIQRRGAWEGPPAEELARLRSSAADALVLLADARRDAGAGSPGAAVIQDFARVRLDALLSLHALNGGPAALDDVRLDVWSGDADARSAALELAEELLPSRAVAALSRWAEPGPEAPRPPAARTRAALRALDPALARLLEDEAHAARAARLRGVPLLRGLETPYLLQLLESSRERTHAAGDALLREGDRGDALLLIEDGAVSVRSGGRVLASLGGGECLGELSVIDGRPRSADAVCAAPTRLLVIEQEAFRDVAFGRPAVGLLLARTLERRLRSALPPAPGSPESPAGARPLPGARERGVHGRLRIAAALGRAPLLAGLSEPVLAAVAGLARPVPVFSGELLFEEGSRGDALYVIGSGRVQVESRSRVVAELGPWEVFGELALLSGQGRTAAVRIKTDGLLFAVDAGAFHALLRDEPTVLWALLETLAGRLRAALSPASAPRH